MRISVVNGKQYVLIASGGSSLIGAGSLERGVHGFFGPSPTTSRLLAQLTRSAEAPLDIPSQRAGRLGQLNHHERQESL
jgi:hypothetical protein